MAAFFQYILISTACLSICYGSYMLFFRNQENYNQLRLFLLSSLFIAMILPSLPVGIQIYLLENNTIDSCNLMVNEDLGEVGQEVKVDQLIENADTIKLSTEEVLVVIYFLVVFGLLVKFLFNLIHVLILLKNSERLKKDGVTIVLNKKVKSPFTFFKWVFIPINQYNKPVNDEILIHEKVHALQYHSIDILLIELLSAVMWFNPLVWMMRRSIHLVHEFLADEGVLSTGIDRLRYQALLINQVAEERLICLSSGFNHSIIKKRMIMMTKKRNFNQSTKFRILILLPLVLLLLFGIACVNGRTEENFSAASINAVKMNVLYAGIDNSIAINIPGYNYSDLTISVDNGTVSDKKNGKYVMVRPDGNNIGNKAIVKVSNGAKLIKEEVFRIKRIPDPVFNVGQYGLGKISKKHLLSLNEVKSTIKDFDFDVHFKVKSFNVCVIKGGYIITEPSKSSALTSAQKKLITKMGVGSKISFENIKCKGPDGNQRKIADAVLVLTE